MGSLKITQVSNLAILGVRDDGELHQSGSSGEGGENWSDSGYILNVETTDFPNRVAMMCEKKRRESRTTPRVLAQATGRMEFR